MINPKNKYKIALVGYTLNKGGLEKVMSNLSLYFDSKNMEVHTILICGDVAYPYGGILKSFESENKYLRYVKLYAYFRKNKFDFIIDFRFRLNPITEFLITKIIYNAPVISTVHSSKIEHYFPENKYLTKWLFNSSYAVVCVAEEIEKKVKDTYQLKNCTTIYNAIDFNETQKKSQDDIGFDFKYIIAVGRFEADNIKQFDELIATYINSNLPLQEIHLVLMGDGETKAKIQSRFKDFTKIHFIGFKKNPYSYLKKAQYSVLSSKYEGFPMVLLESLASGIPVVSFDCETGPKEIIVHEQNGLLVKNQDFNELKLSMERMVTDNELYQKCKNNAISSVKKFDTETIGKEWLQLLKIDLL